MSRINLLYKLNVHKFVNHNREECHGVLGRQLLKRCALIVCRVLVNTIIFGNTMLIFYVADVKHDMWSSSVGRHICSEIYYIYYILTVIYVL